MPKDYKRNEVYIMKHIYWRYLIYHAGWYNLNLTVIENLIIVANNYWVLTPDAVPRVTHP